MDDAALMGVVEGGGGALDDGQGSFEIHPLVFLDQVMDGFPIDEFENQIDVGSVLDDGVDLHDIGMMQGSQELGLVDEYVEHLEAIEDDEPIMPRVPVISVTAGPHMGLIDVEHGSPWDLATRIGLFDADYGQTWFVYESRQDYEDGLD